MIKKYWDIISGIFTGLLLSYLVSFRLEKIQLLYSIVILMLVCVGLFKVIRQTFDKKRKPTVIDSLVDHQKSMKAISLAENPTKLGEHLGEMVIETCKGGNKLMNKFKIFLEKFKGYIATVCLAILTVVEFCGGYLSALCNDFFVINGIHIIPIVTLICTVIIGLMSNTFTKDQLEQIKKLFNSLKNKDSNVTNDLVKNEIKNKIKVNNDELKRLNKDVANKENDIKKLETELNSAKQTVIAKEQMFGMIPKLATAEEVEAAKKNVVEINNKLAEAKKTLENLKNKVTSLETENNALKSQL